MSSPQHAAGSVYPVPQWLPQRWLPTTASCAPPCSARPCQAPGHGLRTHVSPAPSSPVQPSAIPFHPQRPQHSFSAAPHGAPERACLQWLLATCSRHARLQVGPGWSLHFLLRHSLMACWKSRAPHQSTSP